MPPDGPFEKIEAEIAELWGHINAATYRFLKLVAEYDVHECWAWHGCRNCAQWLNWRCGIDIGAAREKVRTARALDGLPGINEAFAAGRLSYSKVRALTRIATPENEAELLKVALHGTAAHVEKLVRLDRRVERLEEAGQAMQAHWQRSVRYFYDDDGLLILQARLPAEVGAMVLKALEAAEEIVFEEQREAPVARAAQAYENVSAETPDDASAELVDVPASARRADALSHVAEHFLSRSADLSTTSAARYQVVVHIDQQTLSDGPAGPPTGSPQRCELDGAPRLAVDTAKRLGCDAALVGLVEADGEALSVGRRTRSIPPAIGRALQARDGGCRFPGCTQRRFTEGHHVRHWA